ncbi:hypothetical protein [Burkholderia sp. Leaf177]|uniref:hypothetical protein n=1 Tax=Burkholderia sp. Leaf177 TaxID=1736287 RepID=UPI000AE18E5B|nr:hypothetical protein [Burkholderia sp. Leaf177]
MKASIHIKHGRLIPAAILSATFFATDVLADDACPQLVESRAGSVFNMSAFIKDKGSPEAALNAAREAVTKVNRGGGCRVLSDVPACEETLKLASVAIEALQTCAASRVHRPMNNSQANG